MAVAKLSPTVSMPTSIFLAHERRNTSGRTCRKEFPSLATVLAEATAHAGRIMRGQKLGAPVQPVVSAPPVMNGTAVVRTAAQERLDVLLQEQGRLGKDTSPEGYRQNKGPAARATGPVTCPVNASSFRPNCGGVKLGWG
jgi:hypothetical protein